MITPHSLAYTLDRIVGQRKNIVIISGGARGADLLGERFASERGFSAERFLPDWKTHGRAAGPIRNSQMVDVADETVFFWDGQSRGTANAIQTAMKKEIPSTVVKYLKNWVAD